MTGSHVATRTLTESVMYPDHDPRKASREYKAVHHHLIYVIDEACWICGIRRSTGGKMETHHQHLEWALAQTCGDEDCGHDECNPHFIKAAAVLADFPEMGAADDEHLREWLDSEGNMLVLCDAHHRHGLVGIHMITYPAWQPQRWEAGHDISTGE